MKRKENICLEEDEEGGGMHERLNRSDKHRTKYNRRKNNTSGSRKQAQSKVAFEAINMTLKNSAAWPLITRHQDVFTSFVRIP